MGDAAEDMLRNHDEYEATNRKGKMAKDKTNKPDRGGGGLSVLTFGGLNAENYTAGVGLGDRLKFEKKGKEYPVQFTGEPDNEKLFVEFFQHQFRDKQGWRYVPCLGEDCPLCSDEEEEVRKRRYRFVTNVYSFRDKKVVIWEGPKDAATRIGRRYESVMKAIKAAGGGKKKEGKKGKKGGDVVPFLERVYGITQNDVSPVTYDVAVLEDQPVKIDPKDLHDLHRYINSAAERFYQGKPAASKKSDKKKGKSALDAGPTQEDSFTEEQLKGLSEKKLIKAAKSFEIDTDGVDPAKLIKKILKAQK